jgi:CRISPR-associated endoribonuclease Cas6
MRISIEFKTSKFPQAYSMQICSMIKEALKTVNEEYYKTLYLYGDKKSKKTKNFTFSTYVSDYELKDDVFIVKDKVVVNISTPDYEFGINLYNGILSKREFKYKNEYELYAQKVRLIREKTIIAEEVKFKTLSSIYIKDKDNNSLDYNTEEFVKELNYISDVTLKQYRGYGLKRKLDFIHGDMKKKVVKLNISDFKQKTNKEIMYVNSYQGEFKLCGDIEDLSDIYMLGLGFRRNEGFGMIEVSREGGDGE